MGLNVPHRKRGPDKRRRPDASASAADKPGLAARQAAHRILGAILDAKSSMDGLTDEAHGHPQYLALEPRDRALVRAILLTALRNLGELDATVSRFTEKPLPAGATGLRNILLAGLAQILFLDVPDHSAVDLAVTSAQADPRCWRSLPSIPFVRRNGSPIDWMRFTARKQLPPSMPATGWKRRSI